MQIPRYSAGLRHGKERLTVMAACSCLLFDLGQVLVSINFGSFGDRMRELTGLDAEELRNAIMGNGLEHRYELGLLSDQEFHSEVCRRVGSDIPWDQFVAAWNSIFVSAPLIPEYFIVDLAKTCPLWIVSNTNRIHFDFIKSSYPLLRHFNGFILSYEVGLAKPNPAIYRLALKRAGVEAAGALFVDDQALNVQAAKDLGLDAIRFLSLDQFIHELRLRNLLP